MRNVCLTALLLVTPCLWPGIVLMAQDSSTVALRITPAKDRVDDKILIELSNDFWLDLPAGVEHRGFSPGIKAYFFSDYPLGAESPVSFAWGFGISSDNVHTNAVLENSLTIGGETGDLRLRPYAAGSYDKIKFSTTFVELPVELRFITKGEWPFKLAAGFRVGYLLQDKQKIVDPLGKRKLYNFDYINEWRYGVSARIGFGAFQVSAFYSLVPLIEEGFGPELIPFSVGLTLSPAL